LRDKDDRPEERPEWPNTTCTWLIQRAKDNDANCWWSIVHLYAPLVLLWCRQHGLCGARSQDAQEVVWEVFETVRNKLLSFAKDGNPAAFRRWLKTITHFKVLEYWSGIGHEPLPVGGSESWMNQLPDKRPPPPQEPIDLEPVSDRVLLLRRLLERLPPKFEGRTVNAFLGVAADGRPAKDVAEELGLSVPAVHTAKSKVLKWLKQELKAHGLLPDAGKTVAADGAAVTQSEVTS
jgi:RNA polymerase sigma-70 factor (ECF subfamily)